MPNIIGQRYPDYVEILKCSNPILHYQGYSGTIGEVTFETRSAFWLRHPSNRNFWVYKRDVKRLDYLTRDMQNRLLKG
jgi:hypothetical protein